MTASESSLDRQVAWNTGVLALAQSTNYAVAPLSMAVGGLAGHYLLGEDKSFATLPITFFVLGPLFCAMPAAILMRKIGRKAGFLVGSAIGFTGCAAAAFSILQSSFVLLCFSLLVIGISIGFAQQYRFAAADFGSNAARTRALSFVMAGGLLAAVFGPQMALLFSDFFDPVLFAGSFVGGMLLCVVGFCALLGYRERAKTDGPGPKEEATELPERPLSQIIRQPVFLVSALCGASGYMMMSLVMTAAPLAMIICGHSTDLATLGIQWHVMAMFGPSFFTGSLILRFGHRAVIGTGFLLYILCGAIALSGIDVAHFWAALIFLGIAWNFSYIGATSLVTKAYRPTEKNKVQGFFDTIVFALVAMVSLLSGVIMANFGWSAVVLLLVPLLGFSGYMLIASKAEGLSLKPA